MNKDKANNNSDIKQYQDQYRDQYQNKNQDQNKNQTSNGQGTAASEGGTSQSVNVMRFPLKNGSSFVFLVFFMGILLSGAVYYGISAIMGTTELCDDYYDGGDYDHAGIYALDDVFFKDSTLRDLAVKAEYVLFGRIDNENIIVGRDGFLFSAVDETSGYDYVRDYIGELSSFSETEALCQAVKQRSSRFSAMGVEYILAVIPNAQTIYSDKMPGYFGNISEDTRLARLARRMSDEDVTFLDLTAALGEARDAGILYNNTENSLNALGAYYAYLAVYEAMPEIATSTHSAIAADDVDFLRHVTDGRSLAREAGLEKLIANTTISLPGDMQKKFNSLGYFSEIEITAVKKEYRDEMSTYPSVLVEFCEGDEWDKMLMYEYFSNTFGSVGYRIGNRFSSGAIKDIGPRVVVQFVRECDLHILINEDVVTSYAYDMSPTDSDDGVHIGTDEQ